MSQIFLTTRIQPQEIQNFDTLIQFLQKAKAQMLQDEDLEFVITSNTEDGVFHFGLARLAPSEKFDPDAAYEVIPTEAIHIPGVIDELNENGSWKRIYPPR